MVGVDVREFPAVLLEKRTHKEIMAAVQALTPPIYIPPYPAKHNLNADRANARSEAWMLQHFKDCEARTGSAVFSDPKKIALFIRSKINDLFAWTYSEAEEEEEEAFWLCCLGLWYFIIIDDVLDETVPSTIPSWSL
jgi:hypothetical protein